MFSSKPMHIVHLADSVFRDQTGGSRRYALEAAQAMVEQGHRVTFLVERMPKTLPADEDMDGLRVLRYGGGNNFMRQRALRRAFRALHASDPVDAVFVHFAYTAWGYHRMPLAQQIPTVRVFHGPWDQESVANQGQGKPTGKRRLVHRVQFLIERFSLRRSHQVVALSEFMARDAHERFGISRDKISVIPGGVNPHTFSPGNKCAARQELGLPQDALIVFTARRLVPRMGIDKLIEAVAQARMFVPNLHLYIAGKGPLNRELARQIDRLGLKDWVHLVGFVPDAALPHYYQAADVFLLPTQALEGFGLIILEAMACNTPVLGTPVGAIPEVLREFDPTLVLPGMTADQMASGLVTFCRKADQHLPDYRTTIEQRFTWNHVAERLIEECQRIKVGQEVPPPQFKR